MKQRFSSLDIKVIAHELSTSIVPLRASNIYDLSSRIFLFKFQLPGRKEHFLLDSGFRCHLTSFARTTADSPSAFTQRLRKFLRDRRCTSVAQVGTDRILELQFSDGRYRLFLEFYAGGNVVLCDSELKVIALLRQVNEGAAHEQVRLGSTYNLSERQNVNGIEPLTEDRIRNGLKAYADKQEAGQASSNKKLKKKPGDALRKALASVITEYPPMLVDHSLRSSGFNVELQPDDVLNDQSLMKSLLDGIMEAGRLMEAIMAADVAKGYIFGKANPKAPATDAPANEEPKASILYNDYHPFKPKHLLEAPDTKIIEFDGFNKTVDEFYSSIEGQRLETRLAEKEESARKKMEHARLDQEKRLGGLQEVQALNIRKAAAIEANVERVQETTAAINGLIAQGKDWDEVEKLIQLEKKRGNPVAEIIKLPLKLSENTATLLLGEWENDEDDDEGNDSSASEPSSSEDEDDRSKKKPATGKPKPADKRLTVDIDLAQTPWANAREYYDQKKTAAAKEEKTILASAKALKSTERKVQADLNKALKQEKQILRPVRQPFWFEKFAYFLSSDGYLVLGGKDAQQSDILYRRHLKKGDAFVHADLDGAMSCIIKNRSTSVDDPIPPSTLSQAGNLAVCTSTAWDSKAVMSAWWAAADQITKKASTGDVLGPGKFEVKGEKKFLPPAQLLLGFAVLFYISEESKANHTKHRIPEPEKRLEVGHADGSEVISQEDPSADTQDAEVDRDSESEHDDDEHDEQESTAGDDEPRTNPLQPKGGEEQGADDDTDDEQPVQEATLADEADAKDITETLDEPVDEEDEDEGEEDLPATQTDQPEQAPSGESRPTTEPNQPKQKTPLPIRGQRAKAKKTKTKYSAQDDEDRAAALAFLGSASGAQKATDAAAAKAARDAEAAATRARRREQHTARAAAVAAAHDEDPDADDVEGGADVDLARLVATPRPGDAIVEAIPVCGPWGALGSAKYKAKLQPGAVKKGKAVREILGRWAAAGAVKRNVDERAEDVERMWPREIECVRAWREAEVFGVVPVGKVRVMMSGGGGGSSGGGGKDKKGKPQKGRSGKGSKKQR